jgi:hypothetical protein
MRRMIARASSCNHLIGNRASFLCTKAPMFRIPETNFLQGITSISGRDVQAIFRRHRHQPRRPLPANIRPGSPAPTMGPGTGDATRPEVLKAQVLRASVQKLVAPAATWLRTKPWGDPVRGRKFVYAATLLDPKSMMRDATVSPEKVYEPGLMS